MLYAAQLTEEKQEMKTKLDLFRQALRAFPQSPKQKRIRAELDRLNILQADVILAPGEDLGAILYGIHKKDPGAVFYLVFNDTGEAIETEINDILTVLDELPKDYSGGLNSVLIRSPKGKNLTIAT